jgi:hypothetical protein
MRLDILKILHLLRTSSRFRLVNFAFIFHCSNNADVVGTTENEDNFGLDDYEPKFFHPLTKWAGYGKFQVFLKFDAETDYTKDIFYFCHVSSNEICMRLINHADKSSFYSTKMRAHDD